MVRRSSIMSRHGNIRLPSPEDSRRKRLRLRDRGRPDVMRFSWLGPPTSPRAAPIASSPRGWLGHLPFAPFSSNRSPSADNSERRPSCRPPSRRSGEPKIVNRRYSGSAAGYRPGQARSSGRMFDRAVTFPASLSRLRLPRRGSVMLDATLSFDNGPEPKVTCSMCSHVATSMTL